MRNKRSLALVTAVVAMGGLVACSSSGGGNSDKSGASGSSWKVGAIASCSGAQASSEGGVCKTLKAWESSVNAAGGINGHKINLIVKDDASNPTTSTTMVRELVEKDHVIAIVGDQSNVDSTWATYVQAKGVPVVGGLPINAPFISNPDFFGIGTNLLALNYAAIQQTVASGYKKVGFLYCAETPQCAQSVPSFTGAAKLQGASTMTAKVAGTAPDYTSQCLKLKNSGVEAYEVGSGAQVVQRVADACAQQGVKAKMIAVDGTVTNAFLKDKNFEGMVGVELTAPWFDTSVPGIAEYHTAMKKYAPSVINSDLFGSNSTYAWISGKLFEAAAKAGNLGDNPTSADVKKGLFALKNETLNGLTAPLTYTESTNSAPFFNSCYFPISIKGGQFVSTSKDPVCIPKEKLASLLEK